jgi:hypothetical protein
VTCRLNCTCRICGRVRLHVTKSVRRAKPKPVDPATVALAEAMRRLAGGR